MIGPGSDKNEGLFGMALGPLTMKLSGRIDKRNILLNHLALTSEIKMLNMLSAKLKEYYIFQVCWNRAFQFTGIL